MSAHLNQQRFTDGAAHVIDPTQVPRYSVAPTYNSKPANSLRINAPSGGIEEVAVLCFVTNAAGFSTYDAVIAAERIASMHHEVEQAFPGDLPGATISIPSDGSKGNITKVCILPMGHGGTDTTPADGIVDSSNVKLRSDQFATTCGTVGTNGVTAAELLAGTNMTVLDFENSDAVRSVRVVVGNTFGGGQLAYMNVTGASYGA